jgi:hypothetical protein
MHSQPVVVQTGPAEVDTARSSRSKLYSTQRARVKLLYRRFVIRQTPTGKFGKIVDFNDHRIDALPSYPLHPKPTLEAVLL